jgi:hypothetical protein
VFSDQILEKLGITFARAFVGAFVAAVAAGNIANLPNIDAAKSLLFAAVAAAVAAGVHAVTDAVGTNAQKAAKAAK